MSRQNDKVDEQQVWKSLSEAGLDEIALDEFPERIKAVKLVVMGRLSELLELKTSAKERDFAAYSLGTLKNLESSLGPDAPAARRSGRPKK